MASLALKEAANDQDEGRDDIQVVPAPSVAADKIWPDIEHFVDQACAESNGDMTPEVARRLWLEGRSQLWIVIQGNKAIGFAMSRIEQWALRKPLIFWLGGGEDGEKWFASVVDAAEDYAAETNCDSVDMEGRWGWQKWLKPYGYKMIRVYYRKELRS